MVASQSSSTSPPVSSALVEAPPLLLEPLDAIDVGLVDVLLDVPLVALLPELELDVAVDELVATLVDATLVDVALVDVALVCVLLSSVLDEPPVAPLEAEFEP